MDLAAHLRVILQSWWRILLVSLAIAAIVFAFSASRSNVYRADATLSVSVGRVSIGQTPIEDTAFFAQTYAELATTPTVVRTALDEAGLDLSVDEATDRITAEQQGNLGFIEVSATGPSLDDAEELASAVGGALIQTVQDQQEDALVQDLEPINEQITQVEAQLLALPPDDPARSGLEAQRNALIEAAAERRVQPTNQLLVVTDATGDDQPVSPSPFRDALLAFLAALVVTAELTVVLHAVGDRFTGADDSADVNRVTGLPVLAKIPRGSGVEVVEAFRVLRTNLMFLEAAGKPRTVAIVSANSNAGKTFCAINLAQSAAGLDEKVVLVDGDLRKPAVHERLGVELAPGLSSLLQGGDIASALRKVPETPFLRVLPSGSPVQDPSGVLGARAFRHVLDALRAVRLVVVDTPPAALFADSMAIASQCDATLFVLDVKTSRRRAVRSALEALEQAGANVVGVVVNRTATPRHNSYYDK